MNYLFIHKQVRNLPAKAFFLKAHINNSMTEKKTTKKQKKNNDNNKE